MSEHSDHRDQLLRAYEWAERQMNRLFPEPDVFKITGIERWRAKPNTHVSLFRGMGGDEAIVRVYWADTNSVKYSRVVNYAELLLEAPDVVDTLERNGLEVFEMALAKNG